MKKEQMKLVVDKKGVDGPGINCPRYHVCMVSLGRDSGLLLEFCVLCTHGEAAIDT